MKITLKKLIKGIIPYGITWLIENKQSKSGEVIEPRGGRSPDKSPFPPPQNVIPENAFHEYTLNGKMKVLYMFRDSRTLDNKKQHNNKKKYNRIFRQLQYGTFRYYGKQGEALLQAFNNYSVKGKDVIIWGLAGCNCEAIAVWKGANKVYVVDYNKPICDNEKIEVLNHEEITQKEITTDFAISYSTFEHDGLGRYGDPLSPNGDFRAMREAHKFSNDNGILFLGVPLGEDCIVWNTHRIYGKNRLPLLLKG